MFQRMALALVFVCAGGAAASAQDRSPRIEGTAGHAAFVDEDPIDHFMFGGAARLALTPRLSVGPEVVYMIGPGADRDLFVTGNVWFDLLRPGAGRRVTPYVVAGGGFMRHRDEFITDFTSTEGAFTGGVGLRIALHDRWYIAPEARLGWETHSRLTASVGYAFGR